MSKMAVVENIYDALTEAGLKTEHACFDDLVFGCTCLAVDPAYRGKEVLDWIADQDDARDEIQIALDIKEFFRISGCPGFVTDVVAKAVAAGRAAWEGGSADED